MNYVQNLIKFRKSRKISQNELAELLQTTQQQISKYEKGLQEMPVRHLITIADTYNTSIDYLTGRTENKVGDLSQEQLKIIKQWNILTERNKGKIELLMEQLLETQAEIKEVI